jgi:selenocysteine lyase/cysteine desulfurase
MPVGPVTIDTLREQFPVCERLAYLNAGTDGPLPDGAAKAAAEQLQSATAHGRSREHFELRSELSAALRGSYATALGCDPADLALTTCTSEGLAIVLSGLPLGAGDEVLTTDEEHPGLLGVLGGLRDLRGVSIREAPFDRIHEAVGPRTRIVACSHVSFMTGRLAPPELADVEVPVLLDGAQGVGAIACDVRALKCDAYAGAGQKWLCGPDGTGMLYVSSRLRPQLQTLRRGYGNLADPDAGLDARLHEDARRFDSPALSAETLAAALAAIEPLEQAGWQAVQERACSLASLLSARLASIGRQITPRGATTLVSFSSSDAPAERDRLAQRGVLLRDIPGRPLLRASVGAWNDERDLERLLDALV